MNNLCSGYNKPSATGASGVVMFSIIKHSLKCRNKAKIFENDKWWCKKHAPSEVAKREEKSWNNYIKRLNGTSSSK